MTEREILEKIEEQTAAIARDATKILPSDVIPGAAIRAFARITASMVAVAGTGLGRRAKDGAQMAELFVRELKFSLNALNHRDGARYS